MKLEQKHSEQAIQLSAKQVKFLEKQNPAFRERHVESSRPGELLSQDTFLMGTLKGLWRIYLHTVVDTYSSYGFGFLHTSRQAEAAVAVLHNDVLPFYRKKEIRFSAILTDNGKEFFGKDTHPYEIYLQLNDIKHRKTRVHRPQTNGFVERFNGTVLDEFFRTEFCKKLYETVEELQVDLDAWLVHFNTERPHQGYRNMGRRSADAIHEFL